MLSVGVSEFRELAQQIKNVQPPLHFNNVKGSNFNVQFLEQYLQRHLKNVEGFFTPEHREAFIRLVSTSDPQGQRPYVERVIDSFAPLAQTCSVQEVLRGMQFSLEGARSFSQADYFNAVLPDWIGTSTDPVPESFFKELGKLQQQIGPANARMISSVTRSIPPAKQELSFEEKEKLVVAILALQSFAFPDPSQKNEVTYVLKYLHTSLNRSLTASEVNSFTQWAKELNEGASKENIAKLAQVVGFSQGLADEHARRAVNKRITDPQLQFYREVDETNIIVKKFLESSPLIERKEDQSLVSRLWLETFIGFSAVDRALIHSHPDVVNFTVSGKERNEAPLSIPFVEMLAKDFFGDSLDQERTIEPHEPRAFVRRIKGHLRLVQERIASSNVVKS